MLEMKHMSMQKKESTVGTDDVCVRAAKPPCVYETQDWMVSPPCSPEDHSSSISSLLTEETFRCMILSSDRVEQMNRTYNDVDIVTHLLAERDRDLELAAHIGQSLLQRNHVLQERNESLEEQLTQTLDQVRQLQHELMKKDELLRVVSCMSEESETDSSSSTPLPNPLPAGLLMHTFNQLEILQSKLHELEEENSKLQLEACQLKKETFTYEKKEEQLVIDCVKELRESNSQMVSLSEELAQKNEELIKQQEEIAQLLSQIVQLQQRVKELALEKEELVAHLLASKDAQRHLTAELNELADRNAECLEMLHESQEEVKELRNKHTSAGLHRHLHRGVYLMDSLAAEIEGTMRRERSVDEEITFHHQRSKHERVFRTVQSANETLMRATPYIPGSGDSNLVMTSQLYHSQNTPEGDVQKSADSECTVVSGSRGERDLFSALRRLSLRRQNVLSETQYFQAEKNKKLREPAQRVEYEGCGSSCSSSVGSVCSSFTNLSELSGSSSCFKTFLPEKLQIVKPMEGSLTLHHWQQLAKPHLASILDLHPGVVTKGFKPLPQDAMSQLTDQKEDEEQSARVPWALRRGAEEEEDQGITFSVFSTPKGKNEDSVFTPPKALPHSTCLSASPVPETPSVVSGFTGTSVAGVTSVSQPYLKANTASSPSGAKNPVKCQSSTFSTYTFTTCRILHPSDITQVTPSSGSGSIPLTCDYTPGSLRSTSSTPVTPCRLSLGAPISLCRPTMPHTGLAKLLLEKGISAQRVPAQSLHPAPGTPPNSPCPSPDPFESSFVPNDNFLASRPAELFLQDVYGVKPDLVERLRKLGLNRCIVSGAESVAVPQSSTFRSIEGGKMLVGLKRNQSLPAVINNRSPSYPAPPQHPSSLALPTPPWENLKPLSTRRHASLSQVPPPTINKI